MATITKLKAEVVNNNLPILGSDGKLYNYYTGMYVNRMSDLGHTLTVGELNAINAFIDDGINNGWIEMVRYLMPFLGTRTNPLTGIIPLIDNIADYEIAEESVDESAFTYSPSNRIIACGNPSSNVVKIKLPFSSGDFPDKDFSPFVNFNYTIDMIAGLIPYDVSGMVGLFDYNESILGAGLRWHKNNKRLELVRRASIGGGLVTTNIVGTTKESIAQGNVFYTVYHDSDENPHFKRFVATKGVTAPDSIDVRGEVTNTDFIDGNYILGYSQNKMIVQFNIMAVLNPNLANKTTLEAFSKAVFNLTTALGR